METPGPDWIHKVENTENVLKFFFPPTMEEGCWGAESFIFLSREKDLRRHELRTNYLGLVCQLFDT